jgi:hypothetical protein
VKWNAPSEDLFASPWAAKETDVTKDDEGAAEELNEEELAAQQLHDHMVSLSQHSVNSQSTFSRYLVNTHSTFSRNSDID